MIGGQLPAHALDLFASEGGTAAITYVFNTMRENRLLVPGDKIAIGMPIFTPYLEIPVLNDFQLVEVNVKPTPRAAGNIQMPNSTNSLTPP